MWYALFVFYSSEHVGLSLVGDGEGGGALLPGLSIHMHWNTLVNDDLRRRGEGGGITSKETYECCCTKPLGEEEEEGNLSSVIKSFRELRRCHYAFLLAPTYKGAPSLKTLKSTKGGRRRRRKGT